MIIYSKQITSRLQFTLNFIFNKLGVKYKVVNNINEFEESANPKINYSDQSISDCFQIIPHGLLFENHINKQKPEFSVKNNLPIIYEHLNGNLGFDIFSAVFWFIARYEEHQEFKADNHGRFAATESLLFKNNLLEKPVVDIWIKYFACQLTNRFPHIALKNSKFDYLTTIDVDSPWCYKNKGVWRNVGGVFRDVLKMNLKLVKLRVQVLIGLRTDPWFKFNWLENLQKKHSFKIKYFVHVGNHGTYDKTVSYRKNAFRNFIKLLYGFENEIALHPSYAAHSNSIKFNNEIERLSWLTNSKVIESRQHFLVFQFSKYYNMILELGIKHDYSLGFADRAGFRAGTSNSFYFFDLLQNKQTSLMIHPFVVMDRTLNSYENTKPAEALKKIKELIDIVKETNGTFISLWHNESLSDAFEWKGWQQVFEQTHEYLAS